MHHEETKPRFPAKTKRSWCTVVACTEQIKTATTNGMQYGTQYDCSIEKLYDCSQQLLSYQYNLEKNMMCGLHFMRLLLDGTHLQNTWYGAKYNVRSTFHDFLLDGTKFKDKKKTRAAALNILGIKAAKARECLLTVKIS